jgi:hypothetical protein
MKTCPGSRQLLEGRWTGILYGLGVTLDSISNTLDHEQE